MSIAVTTTDPTNTGVSTFTPWIAVIQQAQLTLQRRWCLMPMAF